MDEKESISLLKQGDFIGLETLVVHYQVLAVHAAQLIVRDRSLAEEAVQDAFLRASERIHQFDQTRAFKPWFMRIVVNTTLKKVRHEQKVFSFSDAEADADAIAIAEWLRDPNILPEEQVMANETAETVKRALNLLSPEQRAVVVMRYFLGMRESEIAQIVDRPTSTVKWWFRGAYQNLKELLKVHPQSEDADWSDR